MTPTKCLVLPATLLATACSAPSQTYSEETATLTTPSAHEKEHHHGHVKPGANVTFKTELREALSPGDAGALEIVMTEGHRAGQMRVTASASDGLEMLTTIDEATFDLSTGDTHNWIVYFDTETAGKYYINLHARVDTPIGPLMRSYAAPVIVGKPEPKAESASLEQSADGEMVVVMEALETISE